MPGRLAAVSFPQPNPALTHFLYAFFKGSRPAELMCPAHQRKKLLQALLRTCGAQFIDFAGIDAFAALLKSARFAFCKTACHGRT
jgi:hypothetical protein